MKLQGQTSVIPPDTSSERPTETGQTSPENTPKPSLSARRRMTVFVFGNPDLPQDALPLRILDRLRERLPEVLFEEKDPNEEWTVPEHLVVIDTVQGIQSVTVFHGLDSFTSSPRVSMHDFDALTQLRFMQKLGKLGEVAIIGIPPTLKEPEALEAITAALKKLRDKRTE